MYAELFGPQSYERAACDFIRNGRKFDLQISRAHATIIALTLGFSGRELDDRFVSFAKILAKRENSNYMIYRSVSRKVFRS